MKLNFKHTLLVFFILPITFSHGQLGNDLILHYSFNNSDATDDAGIHDGTINGPTPCEDRFGNQNMAFQFSNNSITRDNLTFNKLSEATVSFWVKPDSNVLYGPKSNPVGCGVWGMYFNRFLSDGTALSFMDGSSEDNSTLDVTSPLPNNVWFHYATTNDGNTTKIYINGQLETQYAESFLWINSSYNLNLGFRGYGNNSPTDYYNGKLDDLRIYSRAMNFNDINMLYTEPNPILAISENASAAKVEICPNPSSGLFYIDMSNAKDIVEWNLYDYQGKLIKFGDFKTVVIDISKETVGIYYILFKSSNGQIIGAEKLAKIL